MQTNTRNLPAPGQRVGAVTGPGEFPRDRAGMTLCHIEDRWGVHALVLMDSGVTAACHGLTSVGIGWHVIEAPKAAPAPVEAPVEVEVTQQAPAAATPARIKFNLYNVTNGADKARVHYSLDNHIRHAECVTIYAKDYGHALARVLGSDCYQNDTDTMTDYFDKGKVTLVPGHPLYQAARAAAMAWDAKCRAKWGR